MKYRNTKNGSVIETASPVVGGYWELVEEPAPKTPKKKPTKKENKSDE